MPALGKYLSLCSGDIYDHRNDRIRFGEGQFVDLHNGHTVFCCYARSDMDDFLDLLLNYTENTCVVQFFGDFVSISLLHFSVLILYDRTLPSPKFLEFMKFALSSMYVVPASQDDLVRLREFDPSYKGINAELMATIRQRFVSFTTSIRKQNDFVEMLQRACYVDIDAKSEDISLWELVVTLYSGSLLHMIASRYYGYSDYVSYIEESKKQPAREFSYNEFVHFHDNMYGSYGAVHRVMHLTTHRIFAIKTSRGKSNALKLRREYDLLRKFQHPAIIHAFGFIRYDRDDQFSIVLEDASYGSFDKIREMYTNMHHFHLFAADIAGALSYMHGMGYVHRDVKISNIVVGYGLQAKLCDFGSCCSFEDASLDIEGNVSSEYMALETRQNNEFLQVSDVYMFSQVMDKGFGVKTYRVGRVADLIDDRYGRKSAFSILVTCMYDLMHVGSLESMRRCATYITMYENLKTHEDTIDVHRMINEIIIKFEQVLCLYKNGKEDLVDVREVQKLAMTLVSDIFPLECTIFCPNSYILLIRRLFKSLKEISDAGDANKSQAMTNKFFAILCATQSLIIQKFAEFIDKRKCLKSTSSVLELEAELYEMFPIRDLARFCTNCLKFGMDPRSFVMGKYLLKHRESESIGMQLVVYAAQVLSSSRAIRFLGKWYAKRGLYDTGLDWFVKLVDVQMLSGMHEIIEMLYDPKTPDALRKRINNWITSMDHSRREVAQNMQLIYNAVVFRRCRCQTDEEKVNLLGLCISSLWFSHLPKLIPLFGNSKKVEFLLEHMRLLEKGFKYVKLYEKTAYNDDMQLMTPQLKILHRKMQDMCLTSC